MKQQSGRRFLRQILSVLCLVPLLPAPVPLLPAPVSLDVRAQLPQRGALCLLWYNVENLFHPEDDSIAGDEEFTPHGPRHWTWTRYRNKLSAVAKVIVAAGRGEPPELVGLCEVENSLVLEDLCSHAVLQPYGYSYLHHDSPDHRGMDVACLVRRERVRVLLWESIAFAPPLRQTRDMMHVALPWEGDTLDLFLVHLLSKYRGAGATADLRRLQAEQLVRGMDSIGSGRKRGWIMALGDFNDSHWSYSMEPLRKARPGGDSLVLLLPAHGPGSYKYQGAWIPIDQVLVTHSFPAGLRVSALLLDPLLTEDLEYGGVKPFRCYEGYVYRAGISDHLPLLIDLHPR